MKKTDFQIIENKHIWNSRGFSFGYHWGFLHDITWRCCGFSFALFAIGTASR